MNRCIHPEYTVIQLLKIINKHLEPLLCIKLLGPEDFLNKFLYMGMSHIKLRGKYVTLTIYSSVKVHALEMGNFWYNAQ